MTAGRPDVKRELAALTDFQRKTVHRVHERFWDRDEPTRRFLVADEVGLGKTMVARGVIARAVDQLWDSVDRIDVVYICSNAQIAQQNLPKLRVGVHSAHAEMHHADRLTMLATQLRHLENQKVNFVSFTPGTSFNISKTGGRSGERVLLYWLLKRAWGGEVRRGPWVRFFRGSSGLSSFEWQIKEFDTRQVPHELGQDFARSLETLPGPEGGRLTEELRSCVDEFRRISGAPQWPLSHRRYRLIGAMRQALARSAVRRLEPDLVILDEFQRFKDLMRDEGEGAELARELFNHGDARLLLLSATPFKMYTLPEEPEGDDHYRDFIHTYGFLAGDERAGVLERDLADLRGGIFAGDLDRARAARDRAQTSLRRVMSRTERLAVTPDRDGFVAEKTLPGVALAGSDVRDYARLSAVASLVKAHDPLEYWRSAPYVLELMETYQMKQKLLRHDPSDPALATALGKGSALDWGDVQRYAPVDPGNAKMRGLVTDVLDPGAWRLAWIPPSCPYYEPGGAYAEEGVQGFTKRLVFSSWAVAPKAVATLLSYDAERRISEGAVSSSAGYARYDAPRPTGLLAFQRSDDRLTGLRVLLLLYPCVRLARAGDPLDVARALGATLPLRRVDLEREVRRRVTDLLAELPAGPAEGPEDSAWYWACGPLLDRAHGVDRIGHHSYGVHRDSPDETAGRFAEHTELAGRVVAAELGRRPADLPDVLTQAAIAAPGIAALRALSRVCGWGKGLVDSGVGDAASRMAWSLRNLFNRPEITGIVRGEGEDSYWRDVLTHSVDGGLQSVLDEYVHVLDQATGQPGHGQAAGLAGAFDEATSLRTSVQNVTGISVSEGQVAFDVHRIRTHLAVRFGRGVAEDDKSVTRERQVRSAFNSPFWPFVLASTSVGQEGLDFHHYSHAVVHWNLPSNPVDLEQREGRVHRYRGHAVRRNVAAAYGHRAEVVEAQDPWSVMFDLAAGDRPEGVNEIYPSWIPPLAGAARIERYVPALPLSKESHALRRLLRTVGAYRMVLGQPRQEDLLRYLGERSVDMTGLHIDLEP